MRDEETVIDATRLDLAREFRRNPFAKHSPELYALLETLRGPRFNGNYVLVVAEPHKRYVLAVKQPGGKPPIVLGNEVYGSAADAEWAVFKRRWEAAAGQPLAIE
ncbi:MAG: hypothetical protein ACK51F_15730 [Rhodospirillales bacterium]